MTAESAKDRMRAARNLGSPTRRQVGDSVAGAAPNVAAERKVRITVDLPESLHRALRIRVAKDGIDAQRFIRAQLEQLLADEVEALTTYQ